LLCSELHIFVAQGLTSRDPVCVMQYANSPFIHAAGLAIMTNGAALRYLRPNYRIFEPGTSSAGAGRVRPALHPGKSKPQRREGAKYRKDNA